MGRRDGPYRRERQREAWRRHESQPPTQTTGDTASQATGGRTDPTIPQGSPTPKPSAEGGKPQPHTRRRRIHWDDFFRPLDQPLRALPYAGDDLDVTMRVLGRLADQDGVTLSFPTVWRREDPWA